MRFCASVQRSRKHSWCLCPAWLCLGQRYSSSIQTSMPPVCVFNKSVHLYLQRGLSQLRSCSFRNRLNPCCSVHPSHVRMPFELLICSSISELLHYQHLVWVLWWTVAYISRQLDLDQIVSWNFLFLSFDPGIRIAKDE